MSRYRYLAVGESRGLANGDRSTYDEHAHVREPDYFNDRDRTFTNTFDRHATALLAARRAGEPPPVPATADGAPYNSRTLPSRATSQAGVSSLLPAHSGQAATSSVGFTPRRARTASSG